jgi:hypothetical protein
MIMQSLKFLFIVLLLLTTFNSYGQEGRILMTKELTWEERYFSDRYYISGKKVSRGDFIAELSNTPKAKEAYEKGRKLHVASVWVGVPSLIVLRWSLDNLFEEGSNPIYLAAGLTGILCTSALEYKSTIWVRKSIAIHNNSTAIGARLLLRPGSVVLQF